MVRQHRGADALCQGGGNRRVNAALHRIAITQLRDGPGDEYYRKRIAHGDSAMAALRCLKRRLARKVFASLKADAGHAEKRD